MIGAPLRYLTDRAIQSRHDSLFPWGTFSVNLIGCLMTTYSTFSYETLRLVEQKAFCYAAMNAVVSIIVGLGAAMLAYTTTRAVV